MEFISGPKAHPELPPDEVRAVLRVVRNQGENRAESQKCPGRQPA